MYNVSTEYLRPTVDVFTDARLTSIDESDLNDLVSLNFSAITVDTDEKLSPLPTTQTNPPILHHRSPEPPVSMSSKQETTTKQPYIFEQDPRWTAVDDFQFPHLFPSTHPHHAAISHAQSNSLARGLSNISVAPSQGKSLSIQCQIMSAKHVLEIGTLGAYSTIWMASASEDIKVVTIEIDAQIAEVARENIRFAGMEGQIELIVGDASEVLPRLVRDVEEGRRDAFDFSFIDADKVESLNFFNFAVGMTRKKGVVYVDNMVRKGLLADEELAETDETVRAIRKCVEAVGRDERVDACILQTVGEKNYDGYLWAVVK